jgi:hypothetical protein
MSYARFDYDEARLVAVIRSMLIAAVAGHAEVVG